MSEAQLISTLEAYAYGPWAKAALGIACAIALYIAIVAATGWAKTAIAWIRTKNRLFKGKS